MHNGMIKAWIGFVCRYLFLAVIGGAIVAAGVRLWTTGQVRRIPGAEAAIARVQGFLNSTEPPATDAGTPRTQGDARITASSKPPAPDTPYVRRAVPKPTPAPVEASPPNTSTTDKVVSRKNPYEEEYRKAEQAYQEFWKRVKKLEAEHESAAGASRMEIGDELRIMKGPDIEVRQVYEAAKEKYNAWEREQAPPFTPDA